MGDVDLFDIGELELGKRFELKARATGYTGAMDPLWKGFKAAYKDHLHARTVDGWLPLFGKYVKHFKIRHPKISRRVVISEGQRGLRLAQDIYVDQKRGVASCLSRNAFNRYDCDCLKAAAMEGLLSDEIADCLCKFFNTQLFNRIIRHVD